MSVEGAGSEKEKNNSFFSACVIGAGDVGRDCSPSPPSSTPPHCPLSSERCRVINNKIAASESLSPHHHACSNPTKPLAFPGSPSPRAPCATLLSSEGWACGEIDLLYLQRSELSGQLVRWSGGGRRGTAVPSHVPRPQSRRQKKTKIFFFSEPASSTLNGHLILVDGKG